MSAGILDGFQTIIPTAAAVLSEKRQILRLTQQEVANRAKITLRQYQRLESGERNILTSSFGLACRVIEALDINQLRKRDIRTIEKAELRELPQDAVDRNLPKETRLQALLEKIENPYCYLDNGMIVKLNFAPRGSRTLAD